MNDGKPLASIWLCTRDSALRSLLRAAITSQGLTPLDIKPEQLLANAAAGSLPEAASVMLFDLAPENLDGDGVSDTLRRLAALPWRTPVAARSGATRSTGAGAAPGCRCWRGRKPASPPSSPRCLPRSAWPSRTRAGSTPTCGCCWAIATKRRRP